MTGLSHLGWSQGFVMPPGGLGSIGATSAGTVAAGGQALLSVAKFTGPAAPFVAAAGALLDFISAAFLTPNYGKEYASAFVNQIEYDYMRPNLAKWQSLAADQKTVSAQHAALNVFLNAWNAIVQYCSNPALTSGGIHCLADRERGGKYDWWVYFYDPIANDQSVIPDPVEAAPVDTTPVAQPTDTSTPGSAGGSNTSSTVSASVTAPSKLFLWGGLGLMAFAVGYMLTEAD